MKQRSGKLCEASFFLRSKQIKANQNLPRVCQEREKFVSVFIPAKCVSCADSCIYFILFYLFYVYSDESETCVSTTNENWTESSCMHCTLLCVSYIYVFAVSLANSVFLGPPFMLCEEFKIVYNRTVEGCIPMGWWQRKASGPRPRR